VTQSFVELLSGVSGLISTTLTPIQTLMTKISASSGQGEKRDQPQQPRLSSLVEIGNGMNMNGNRGSQVWIPMPRCTLQLEPNKTNIEIGPSVASLLHDQGTCRPCVLARTKMGCHNGSDCRFCHFQHVREATARPCKARRKRFQHRVEEAMQWMETEAEWLFNDPHWLALVCDRLPHFSKMNQQ